MEQPPIYIEDQRADLQGNVTLTMEIDAYEHFIGMLNRAHVIMQQDGVGPYFALKFMPHYLGRGPVALEISEQLLDVCDHGLVCSLHPYDAPGHGGCAGEPMPCGGSLHQIEEPPSGL